MTEVKSLIDEYAAENATLRAMLQERNTALVMLTAHHGKPGRNGAPVVVVPAAARRQAQTIATLDLKWVKGDWSKGALRIVTTLTDTEKDT